MNGNQLKGFGKCYMNTCRSINNAPRGSPIHELEIIWQSRFLTELLQPSKPRSLLRIYTTDFNTIQSSQLHVSFRELVVTQLAKPNVCPTSLFYCAKLLKGNCVASCKKHCNRV